MEEYNRDVDNMEPTLDPDEMTGAPSGMDTEDNSSGSSGGGGGGYNCSWDYITIQISYDGGATWQDYWSGWAQVCESLAS